MKRTGLRIMGWMLCFLCMVVLMPTNASAAYYTYGDYYVYLDSYGQITIDEYNGYESYLTIPSTMDGYPVVGIDSFAFENCTSLAAVAFPDTLKTIGGYAFKNCTDLTTILFPTSLTSIEDGAFSGCISLLSVTVHPGLNSIGSFAFSDCSSLISVYLPSSLRSIGEGAFNRCISIRSFKIPSGLTSIGQSAFAFCSRLESISIPSSVTAIGKFAFFACEALSSITFSANVTTIGEAVFYGCSNLEEIVLPASVKTIGSKAFAYIDYFAIGIPASVTSIAGDAFYGCEGLAIIGFAGSYAETYANKYSIEFYPVFMPPTITGVTVNKTNAYVGDSITCTINVIDGAPPLSYCFYVYKNGVAIYKGAYSASTTLNYTFTEPGSYKVQCYVKDAENQKASKYSDVITVAPSSPLIINSVTANKTSAAIGDAVTYTITAAGGSNPYAYCFYIYKDGAVFYKGSYSSSNTFSYTFNATGSYKVLGYVKDTNGTKATKYSAVINVTASAAPLSINSITANKTSAAKGDSATYTITATGGKGPYSYCFYVYKDGTVFYKGSYNSSNTFGYTFNATGSYKVLGYVKDTNGTKATKYSAVINVTASAAPLSINSITANKTSATEGDTASYTITATGGKGPYSYCFYVYKDGAVFYKGSYSSSNTFSYTFNATGSYKVLGYVKDTNGTKATKYSAVINVTIRSPLSISSITANKTSIPEGGSVTYTIAATGGSSPYTYCFYVYKMNTVVYKGSYGTSNTFTYTFASGGNYKIQGYVKDKNGAKSVKYSDTLIVAIP